MWVGRLIEKSNFEQNRNIFTLWWRRWIILSGFSLWKISVAIFFYLLNIVNSVAVKIKSKQTQKQTMLLFLEYYGNRAMMETKLLNVKQIQWILIYYLYSLINNNTWGRSKVGWDPVGGHSRLFEWARSLKKSDFQT